MPQDSRWIWPFELLERIGEGGMGVVYKARYVVDNRLLAVKMLPADITDEIILGRFERELEILKTLKHPNIVRTFGGVCENKRRFYAMELIEGGTLDDLLRERGRLSWERVIDYGLQMCSALAYSHERGVVHRDVKPGNFLLTADGQLKLSDFGLASCLAARKITAAGRTLGTYFYMAPEQIRGSDVSPKADLYSLGCVLFELLAGHPPFRGATSAETLHKHMREEPPRVCEFAPDCPASLESLILALLEKDPDRRPENSIEVARRLNEVTQVVVIDPRRRERSGADRNGRRSGKAPLPPAAASSDGGSPPRRQWLPTAAVLAVLLLTCGVFLWRDRASLARSEGLWIEAYHGSDPAVRRQAARALGEIAADSRTALETLIAGLEDEDAELRKATAEALKQVGGAARPAVPALHRLAQRDDHPEVRYAAGAAHQAILEAPTRSYGRYLAGGAVVAAVIGLALLGAAFRRSRSDPWAAVKSRLTAVFPSSAP